MCIRDRLQVLMRKLEGDLGRDTAGYHALTFVDGPLTYLLPLEEPILGYVKGVRLDVAQDRLFEREEVRQRPVHERQRVVAGGIAPEVALQLAHQHLQPVSYTHLRAHETVLDLVCRLLL